MNFKAKTFWTIWCIGWYTQRDFNKRVYEFKLFIGPFVLTWWR